MGGWLIAFLALCQTDAPPHAPTDRRASAPLGTIVSEHYRLRCSGTPAEREELARLLEAAHARFARLYGQSPEEIGADGERQRLDVVVFEDLERWEQGVARRGAVAPADAQGLWFRREDETLYVAAAPSAWETRAELLAGAWQQFHYACKAKNHDLGDDWYVRGIGLHLSMHRWDGERLELGVLPRVAPRDWPELALERFDPSVIARSHFTEESLESPPAAWAYVSYLLAGPSGDLRERFQKLALGRSGSKVDGEQLARALGDPELVARDLERWLVSVQLPFRAVCGEWEDLDGNVLRGREPRARAILLLKERARTLDALVEAGTASRAGVVVDWVDARNHVLAWIGDGRIEVYEMEDLRVRVLADEPIRARDRAHLAIRPEGDGVAVLVDGHRVAGSMHARGILGLCLEAGEARFRDLVWR